MARPRRVDCRPHAAATVAVVPRVALLAVEQRALLRFSLPLTPSLAAQAAAEQAADQQRDDQHDPARGMGWHLGRACCLRRLWGFVTSPHQSGTIAGSKKMLISSAVVDGPCSPAGPSGPPLAPPVTSSALNGGGLVCAGIASSQWRALPGAPNSDNDVLTRGLQPAHAPGANNAYVHVTHVWSARCKPFGSFAYVNVALTSRNFRTEQNRIRPHYLCLDNYAVPGTRAHTRARTSVRRW